MPKKFLAIWPTVIFRLSSGVVTATASQPSMPAERRLLMSMGKPTAVTPLKSGLSWARFSGLASISTTSWPASSRVSAVLRPNNPPPTIIMFMSKLNPFYA